MAADAPRPVVVPGRRPAPGDLATFWELALDVLVQVGPDGTFLHVNPAFTHVLGWSRDQVIDQKVFDFLHPDDVEPTMAGFAAITPPGTTIADFENRYRTADGGYRTLRWNARMNMDGSVIHAVGRDVTVDLERLEELRLSEERFRVSMQNAAIGKAILDLDGRFVEVNDALCRIVGRPRDVLTTLTFPDITHPDDLDADLELVAQLTEGAIDHYDLEKRYLRPDGTEVWVLLTAAIIRTPEGDPRHFIAQVQDISRRKAAEAELERTLEELRQSNATLSEFATVVAHDLKTPLAVARGMTELLNMHYGELLPPEARRLLVRSNAQLLHLSAQVDGLLRIASLSGWTMQIEDVALDEALDTTRLLLGDTLADTTIEVTAPDVVRADSGAVTVLLQNLLSNAARHGGTAIRVQSHAVNGWVRVEVDDDGEGIPVEDREGVFDLFARSTTQASGTGVGLALCRRVVERHGGAIGVGDAPLGGARLWFTLPRARGAGTPDPGVDTEG